MKIISCTEKTEKFGQRFPNLITSCLLKQKIFLLPEVEQEIIHLRFWEAMTIEEISRYLGMSWDEVFKILQKALRTLRKELISDPRFYREGISEPLLDPESNLKKCC